MDDNKNNKTTAVDTTFMTDRQKHDVAEMKGFKDKEEMTDYFETQLALIEPPTVAAYTARMEELKNMATAAEKEDLVDSTDIYQATKQNLEKRQDSDSKIVQDVLGFLESIFASIFPMLGMLTGMGTISMTSASTIGSSGISGSNNSQGTGIGMQ